MIAYTPPTYLYIPVEDATWDKNILEIKLRGTPEIGDPRNYLFLQFYWMRFQNITLPGKWFKRKPKYMLDVGYSGFKFQHTSFTELFDTNKLKDIKVIIIDNYIFRKIYPG